MITIKDTNINLEDTITCGQIFRYEKEKDNSYTIVLSDRVVNLKKDYGNKISSFGLFTSKVFSESFKWSMSNIFSAIDRAMNN